MVETKSDAPKVSSRQTFDSVKVAQVFGAQGREGKQGERGETGPQGATYFPELNGSILSWTNNDGLPNPEPVDIKSIIAIGAKGEQGIQGKEGKQGKSGPRGLTGKDGREGKSGSDGTDGRDGMDGATFTPLYDEKTGLLSWTNNGGLENPQPILIKGKDGKNGKDGKHGLGGANAVINGYSTIEIKAGDGIVLTQKKDKMTISADLSGKLGNSGAQTLDGALSIVGTPIAIFSIKNTDATQYSRMLFDGDANDWTSGVGNSSATITDLKNKFYVYDFTNAKIAYTITPDTLATKFYGGIEATNLSGTNTGDQDLSNLVEKETGKGLSTNDYTDADKGRLADTSGTNTGDQDLSNLVEKETGKGLSTNDYTDADKGRLADTSGTNTGDQDLSGLLPKSGGAMTGVLTYASPQVLNMQPVDAEPDVGDMVEGCIYFVAEDV